MSPGSGARLRSSTATYSASVPSRLRDQGVGLAAIQTVFEGPDVNTFDRLRANQRRYGPRIPFGHAVAELPSLDAIPEVMEAYRSGGTPWFVVIAPDGRVVYDGFQLDAESLVKALRPPDPTLPPTAS
jgi:hypothetical protein